jgi:hypothetical protein
MVAGRAAPAVLVRRRVHGRGWGAHPTTQTWVADRPERQQPSTDRDDHRQSAALPQRHERKPDHEV